MGGDEEDDDTVRVGVTEDGSQKSEQDGRK